MHEVAAQGGARIHAFLLAGLLAAAGCGRAVPVQPIPADDRCVTAGADGGVRTRITVAATDAADPRTPLPAAGAHFVFAQLYDTLVEVDCMGRVVAGLAEQWSSDDGRTWEFRVARGATFSDGTPVNAHSIGEAWSSVRVPSLAGVTVIGEHQLRVSLHEPADVRTFAVPMLAAVRAAPGAWPVGTGPYLIAPDSPPGVLRLLARTADAPSPDTIDVRTFAGDSRAALDAGVDALVTADAATLAYARARSDYLLTPLSWSRTHVIATPVRTGGGVRQPSTATPGFNDLTSLARDAVRGDARAAEPPFWWQACSPSQPPRTGTGDERGEILYPANDYAARGIAERVAALAWPRERTPEWLQELLGHYAAPLRTRAAHAGDLLDAARSRAVLAIVTSLRRVPTADCAPRSPDARDHIEEVVLRGWHVTPLIDSRDYMIHRPGTGSVTVDGNGMIRFGRRRQ